MKNNISVNHWPLSKATNKATNQSKFRKLWLSECALTMSGYGLGQGLHCKHVTKQTLKKTGVDTTNSFLQMKNWKRRFFKLDLVKFCYYEKHTVSLQRTRKLLKIDNYILLIKVYISPLE